MFKAKHRQRKNEKIDANLKWLLTKTGQDFFFQKDWYLGQECSYLVRDDSTNMSNCIFSY